MPPFRNTEDPTPLPPGTLRAILRAVVGSRIGHPSGAVPLARPAVREPAGELAVTWYGHSSVLLEIDGRRVLTDPMWGERASPARWFGPRRLHPAPVPAAELPPLDAIVVSHDHYDHLDRPTIRALAADPRHGAAPFVVPLGVGAHLVRWGVPGERVVELGWEQSVQVAGLTLTSAEARHFSGRGLRRDTTLWSSWVIAGPARRAYFGGDTGYTVAFRRTGLELGPFDLTILPIGAYADLWPDIHMTPEQTVAAHFELNSHARIPERATPAPVDRSVLLPVHWATFVLSIHPWAEPVERLWAAAGRAGIRLALPLPGARTDLTAPLPVADWWSAIA